MYLRRLQIQNIKLIRDLTIGFERDGEPRMWTVVLGENGLCKTTVLQAIGLAASGSTRANQLAHAGSLPDRRVPRSKASVTADLEVGATAELTHLTSELEVQGAEFVESDSRLTVPDGVGELLERRDLNSEERRQLREALGQLVISRTSLRKLRAENAPGLLTIGYGVSRILPEPRTSPAPKDPAYERVAPLFGKRELVGTDFIDYLKTHSDSLALDYVKALNHALLSDERILPQIGSFERRGRGGVKSSEVLTQSHRFGFRVGKKNVKVPATWLSHGYQATIAWIADLIGQAFWDQKKAIALEDIRGIALIDELDIHLHPLWQRDFIPALKALFPRVQFIVTTHSPMLLPALEPDEIVRLVRDEKGNVVISDRAPDPQFMTPAELYEAFFRFGEGEQTPLGQMLNRYGFLVGDPGRSEQEEVEMTKLRTALKSRGHDPGWEPVPRREDRA